MEGTGGAGGSAGSALPDEVGVGADGVGGGGFVLEGEAALPGKIRWKKELREYEAVYECSNRTLKRWVSVGRKRRDLPPLDDPGRMAAWWRRVSRQTPPQRLLELEVPGEETAPPAVAVEAAGAAVAGVVAGARITEIDLAEMSLDEDGEVRQARQIVAANFRHLEEASKKGDSAGVTKWQPLWMKSVEQLRKVQASAREAAAASGKLVDRASVLNEIAQLLEALRIARMVMPTKIVNAIASRAEGKRRRRVLALLEQDLLAAVELVRGREDDLLRNLGSLRGPGEVEKVLAA